MEAHRPLQRSIRAACHGQLQLSHRRSSAIILFMSSFEGLVEVDGILAGVGERRRHGEARHSRRISIRSSASGNSI